MRVNIELEACRRSLEKMLERAKLLAEEYEDKIRSRPAGLSPDIKDLEHAISFSELRSLDLMCQDALRRNLPEHEFADEWHIHGDEGVASPEDVVRRLKKKRTVMQHAINIVEAADELSGTVYSSKEVVPEQYRKLEAPIDRFLSDKDNNCHEYDKNVFIMTRIRDGVDQLSVIDKTIRECLDDHNLRGHRADDRVYPDDRNLWDNVCTYMLCCKYGIAVLEDMVEDEFNPNVALEYGFMRALGKPVLLLKEKRFTPRADILGTLWEEFDMFNIEGSVYHAVENWLSDIEAGG